MRIFLGMILGAVLTVSGAYLYDSRSTGAPFAERPMVNWDVVSENWQSAKTSAQRGWTRISSSLEQVTK